MFSKTQSTVRLAVDRLGGATKTAHAVGVSNATIHNWINKQIVPDIDKARLLAKLADLDLHDLRGTR
ncbi:YdaS family helix-turn-helix protein [Cupriavidus campinensis]|jgi:DNA-binding transcriptional regulator YdaS (Cro superfamily)|uniref:YdaS family helix-turn-helix protein n=1 Tax=Cupriavidus campinensis TaxID=151783 RepID=UPI0039C91B2F